MTARAGGAGVAMHVAHPLHAPTRIWPETNCYLDLWIELLNSLGLDPTPMLAVCTIADFEGDQWTFCKPSHDDLYALYGVEVQELTIWRPLVAHLVEQVDAGRVPLVETDAFFLPDTTGVSYGIGHAKTTIAVALIDADAHRAEYFHNAGQFAVTGDDFAGAFGVGEARDSFPLPPFVEIAKLERVVYREQAQLREIAKSALTRVLPRRPRENPIARYRVRLEHDVQSLRDAGLATFHEYAFATLRQCGACAELSASFVEWLGAIDGTDVADPVAAFAQLAADAKALQFKLARAVATGNAQALAPLLDRMHDAWDRGMTELVARYDA